MTTAIDYAKYGVFSAASYLTDPICNVDVDKIYLKGRVFSALFPENGTLSTYLGNRLRGVAIAAHLVVNLILSPFTAPVGAFLRYVGSQLFSERFIYRITDVQAKSVSDSITIFNRNILGIPGENSILHGGAPHMDSYYDIETKQGLPYFGFESIASYFTSSCRSRLDDVVEQIQREDKDLVILQEGFDFGMTERLLEKLKGNYHCMISNVSPKTIGINSGMLILSKYAIDRESVEVVPYGTKHINPQGEEISLPNSEFVEKVFLKFPLKNTIGATVCYIVATHLRHSSEVESPKEEEKQVRRAQVEMIHSSMKKESIPWVLVGDLNADPDELRSHFNEYQLSCRGDLSSDVKTWGGDAFSAELEGIKPSNPVRLDYILGFGVSDLSTQYIQDEIPFEDTALKWGAISDHQGMTAEVKL